MSDPLTNAAGVISILTAAAQISSVLIKFTRSTRGAPPQARAMITEVNDTNGILTHLQAFLLGKDFANISRTSKLKVDQIINVISSCVLTFSDFERLLDDLKTSKLLPIDIYHRT